MCAKGIHSEGKWIRRGNTSVGRREACYGIRTELCIRTPRIELARVAIPVSGVVDTGQALQGQKQAKHGDPDRGCRGRGEGVERLGAGTNCLIDRCPTARPARLTRHPVWPAPSSLLNPATLVGGVECCPSTNSSDDRGPGRWLLRRAGRKAYTSMKYGGCI